MTAPGAALRRLAAGWTAGPQAATHAAAVALATLLAGALGAAVIPAPPALAVLGPAGGVAMAALLRLGVGSGVGSVLGVLLALLASAVPMRAALASALALAAGVVAAVRLLDASAFDPRLDRGRDAGWLAFAIACIAAPLTAGIAVVAWRWSQPAPAGHVARDLFDIWALLVAFMLATALPMLAVDRRWRAPLQTPRRRVQALLLTLALPGCAVALAWLPVAATAALPVLLLALALRGGTAVASLALLPALMLVSIALPPVPALALALAAATLLLLAHAASAEWAWRTQRWEWALDGSRLGVADWHLRRNDSFASAAWCTLTGHGDPRFDPLRWQQRLHPDDQPLLADALAQLTGGASGRAQLELRHGRGDAPDTGWHWLETTLLVIERGLDGRPSRLLATLSDVQDRHEALERQRLSASLFQHLHEGLLVTDADLHALDVNPAYSEILGVPRAEIIGTVPSLLRPTPADPVARQQRAAMWAALRDTGHWRGELLERRRDGQSRTLAATISSVPGPDRSLRYHVLVIADITEQRQARERLERQALYDELTRLPNRVQLSLLLADAMRAADRDGFLLVVCYLDLDRFKPVNDRYGHAAGDRLLTELAGRLKSALRRRDSWADAAARLGGDEFVLLLRAGTMEEARLAVERVLRVVSQPYVVDPAADAVQVTASMGATVYPVDRSDADTLLRHADHAMYGAKQSGRNGYMLFDPEHRRRTEERVMAIGRVQEALDRGEFVLHYQPKVDMRASRVLGFEALLRWEHPQQGLVAPQQFLPLIEHTGLSAHIGDWVFAQALEHLAQWRRNGLDISVSVNVSARHLQEPDFAQRLTELLARHPEPLATHLELEMLETAAHADIDAASALMGRCRAIGVRIALDDFGTGYSTLTYLKRLPVDVLKIDRSFVHHMLDDAQDSAIVEGVIGLARTFGCTVVAEGVETPAQARTLLDMGCDIGQGTGIAAPMPAGQVAGWVKDYRGVFVLAPAPGGDSRPGPAATASLA